MARDNTGIRPSVFISHASADLNAARMAEAALDASGFDTWLDQSDILIGALLRKQLQQAIEASRAVVLLWSNAAKTSRWVASEVLTAFHQNRFVLPCVLSEAELPQFLKRSVHLDLEVDPVNALKRLGDQVKRVPHSHNEFTAVRSYRTKELEEAIGRIRSKQNAILKRLRGRDLPGSKRLQAELDTEMQAAEQRWRYDPDILNLAGYHRKNAYMLKHWEQYCAGRYPEDPVLGEGEWRFFDALFVNPNDCSALNGLGNILLFEGELEAAEFFVSKAIECAAEAGQDYTDAMNDLAVIRGRMGAPG